MSTLPVFEGIRNELDQFKAASQLLSSNGAPSQENEESFGIFIRIASASRKMPETISLTSKSLVRRIVAINQGLKAITEDTAFEPIMAQLTARVTGQKAIVDVLSTALGAKETPLLSFKPNIVTEVAEFITSGNLFDIDTALAQNQERLKHDLQLILDDSITFENDPAVKGQLDIRVRDVQASADRLIRPPSVDGSDGAPETLWMRRCRELRNLYATRAPGSAFFASMLRRLNEMCP